MQKNIFIEKAKQIHGDKYDYSKVEYVNFKTPVCIKCNKHNIEFFQTPALHYHFNGCPECSKEKKSKIRRKSLEDFVKEAKKIYGEAYDYSKVDYENQNKKVCIICQKHGEFFVSPAVFLKGHGCPKCRKEKGSHNKSNTKDFIKKAISVHGCKYDYSKVQYEKASQKVCIICPEHGEFWQTPNKHLQGRGCPKCAEIRQSERMSSNTEDFIEKAKKIHGDKYDYSKVDYIKNTLPITIICKTHGEFIQLPSVHLTGCGCPKCANETRNKNKVLGNEIFIKRAKSVHGDRYDYSHVNYINNQTEVEIICKEHGSFFQSPNKHMSGHGCPKCGGSEPYDTKTFIEKAKKIHGDKYDYSKTEYKNSKEKVCIICPKHGEFWQEAASHLCGTDCPKCFGIVSKSENELFEIVKEFYPDTKQSVRNVISPKEIDIYIPSIKIGFEFNGLRWHSEDFKNDKNYHLNKLINAKKTGVKLVQIFEDEYLLHKDITIEKIKQIIGCRKKYKKIFARKCTVREISSRDAKEFLNENHIQGYGNSSVNVGAFFNNTLIGVMSFKKERKNNSTWELNRFATDIKYLCVGVGGKLFKYFVRNYNPTEIKSFADRRWTINEDDNLYIKLGFLKYGYIAPSYTYYNSRIDSYKRIHKFNFRKKILSKGFD